MKAKYQNQLNEYALFSKHMGLKQERARIYFDMNGRVAPRTMKINIENSVKREYNKNANRMFANGHRRSNCKNLN